MSLQPLLIMAVLHLVRSVPVVLEANSNSILEQVITVHIGSPPVPFTATVDTGSSDFLVNRVDCQLVQNGTSQGACPAEHLFDPNASKTAKPIPCGTPGFKCTHCIKGQCGYEMEYGSESFIMHALLYSDIVTIGDVSFNVTFGATYRLEMKMGRRLTAARSGGFFEPDGIVGMGVRAMNKAGATPLFDAFRASANLEDVFSTCLTPQGNGALALGGVAPFSEQVVYTPFVDDHEQKMQYWYNVDLPRINVGSMVVSTVGITRTIVDTGTMPITVPVDMLASIANATLLQTPETLRKVLGTTLDGGCIDALSSSTLAELPALELSFAPVSGLHGPVVHLSASDYLVPFYSCKRGQVTFAVQADASGFGVVIGQEALRHLEVVYDRSKSRIGLGSVDSARCRVPAPAAPTFV